MLNVLLLLIIIIWYRIELAKLPYLVTCAMSTRVGTFLVLDRYLHLSETEVEQQHYLNCCGYEEI